jgi:hypothetical protein
MFTDATNRTQFFIFYLSLWSHFFAQIGQIRYFLYFVYVKCFICPYGANFLHKLAKYIMLNQNIHNKLELGPKSSNLWNWIETGDRVGSLWISISRDWLENTQSLGHTYLYPRSPWSKIFNFYLSLWSHFLPVYVKCFDILLKLYSFTFHTIHKDPFPKKFYISRLFIFLSLQKNI